MSTQRELPRPAPEAAAAAAAAIRRLVLRQTRRAGVGHIGSALSIADILGVLFTDVLRGVGSDGADRDLFVLSKGHAALALYAALHLRGLVSAEQLDTYCADGSLLGVHPEHELPGIDFSTGSLGHGLAFAAGAALGARRLGSPSRTYVLVSDAELNEGLIWEAAMFAGHHKLGGLVAIVDDNGQQALAHTEQVLNLRPIAAKFRAFGWTAREIDGHDHAALAAALEPEAGAPVVVVAQTVAGSGVSFMAGRVEWHYLPMDERQFAQAIEEVGAE